MAFGLESECALADYIEDFLIYIRILVSTSIIVNIRTDNLLHFIA